jgi:hypothetical protein
MSHGDKLLQFRELSPVGLEGTKGGGRIRESVGENPRYF